MNDERFLKDWLRHTSTTDADSQSAADKVMASVPETGQRSRWWPLLPPRRPTASNAEPARDIKGRTRFMLSPSTLTGGALVVALGGLFLIVMPAAEPRRAPGAQTIDDAAPSLFLGQLSPRWSEGRLESATTGRRDDGSSFDYGTGYEGSPMVTDDPRFTGRFDWIWNHENPAPGETDLVGGIATVLVRVVNDDGSWTGTTTFMSLDYPDWETLSGWLVGEGAYEGLMAYMAMDSNDYKVMGYITPYGPPPVPEGFPSDSTS